MEPRLNEALDNLRRVYFVDAAHFVLGPFLGFLWCLTRKFVKTAPGRQRLNVLGALDAVTRELVTVVNVMYVNADTVCELLHKIAALNVGTPVTLVMDNARYQHCRMVMDLAVKMGIELLFLPPYSPNLNLIERLWKFVKKQSLNSRYHSCFAVFKSAILDCLAELGTKHKSEMKSLLTLNFQTFSPGHFLPE